MKAISPTFLEAKELAALCVECQTGNRNGISIKRDASHAVITIHRALETKEETCGQFRFGFMTGRILADEFEGLSGCSYDDNKWLSHRLEANEIEFEHSVHSPLSVESPSYQFKWRMDENDPTKGKLIFMRINLANDTFVNYSWSFSTGEYRRHTHGKEEILAKLPLTIAGKTEVLGRPIPFEIDFEAEAQKILELSMLKQLVKA